MKTFNAQTSGSVKQQEPERKSKTALFWEKNPGGIIEVIDRRAVNK